MYSPLSRLPQRQAAPANRARRRAAAAQQRRLDRGTIVTPVAALLDKDADSTPREVVIGRAIEHVERQIGRALTATEAEQYGNLLRRELVNLERHEAGQAPVASALRFTDEQEAAGRRLLAELLPIAKERAREGAGAGGMGRHFADALAANGFTLADLEAVLVYEAPPGQPLGWHGGVVLRRAMPPFAKGFGTKVADPCGTREEAIEAATRMLTCFVLSAPEGFDA